MLRWPTFANRKYEHEHIVKARAETTDTYHLEDFRLRTELQDERDRPVSHERRSMRLATHASSQSERDWGYAKRALARGDEPEEVIRRIADYRGDAKQANYARYTVEKAQAELEKSKGRPTGLTDSEDQAVAYGETNVHRGGVIR